MWDKIAPKYVPVNTPANIALVDSFNPPLLSYDKLLFNQYVELVRSRYIDRKVVRADTVLVHATKLLGGIEKEYGDDVD